MSKKRSRKPKPTGPSNAAIARYWRHSDDSDDAYDKFHDAVMPLLEAGKMNHRRCEAVMEYLPGEDGVDFVVDLERLAAAPVKGVFVHGPNGSEPGLAVLRLFGVPISGAKDRIDALVQAGERFDRLTRAVRSSGYAIQDSNIVLAPVSMSLPDMGAVSPGDIHRLAQEAMSSCTIEGRGTSGVVAILKDLSGEAEEANSGGVSLVSRVLIGAQVVILNEHEIEDEELREIDALALLRGDGPEDAGGEDIAQIDEATDAWRALVVDGIEEDGVSIHSPVPWAAIRHTMLANYVHSAIGAAFHMAGRTGDPRDADVILSSDGPLLTLSVQHEEEFLTRLSLPRNIVFDGAEAFLQELVDSYRVHHADEMNPVAPIFN